MQLHHRAMSEAVSTETHSFKIVNIYTGKHITCTLARETKCYYVMWSQELSGGRSLERRFHKATMNNDELCLIIEANDADGDEGAEDDAQLILDVEAELATEAASGYCLNCEVHSNGLTFSADWAMMICPECAKDKADYEANPPKALAEAVTPSAQTAQALIEADAINSPTVLAQCSEIIDRVLSTPAPTEFDKPHFCPACECYAKADEMTASAWVTSLICIDCATAEEDALAATLRGIPECKTTYAMCPAEDRDREIVEAVLEMNYIGGHLAGYHFTPTLKELPRNLFAYQPNNGKAGSPNELINKLGMFVVNLRRGFDTRAIYGPMGNYLIHGDYDVINAYLLAIIDGE